MTAKNRRIIEILLEIATGLLVVAIIYYYATHSNSGDLPVKWIGLAGSTVIVFGYPIYWSKIQRRHVRFWLYLSALLICHLIAFIFVLSVVERWPLVIFVFTSLAEFAFVSSVLSRVRIPQ